MLLFAIIVILKFIRVNIDGVDVMNIKINSNVDLVLDELKAKVEKGLEECGLIAEGYAKRECPVDTGALRNSITHTVDAGQGKAYIGTNMHYASYIEFGTGIHSTLGGRQTPWVYKDDKGNWHQTVGQVGRPFIKPAAANHGDEYRMIIENVLKND